MPIITQIEIGYVVDSWQGQFDGAVFRGREAFAPKKPGIAACEYGSCAAQLGRKLISMPPLRLQAGIKLQETAAGNRVEKANGHLCCHRFKGALGKTEKIPR